jgi:D-alanyl-D-alanine carboxypeptidase/D-alanyl-D-alanine-endopeptidase (penicillin-binding protein 4)
MKRKIYQPKIVLILSFAFVLCGLNFSPPGAAQEAQRQRMTTPTPNSKPTVSPTVTPVSTPAPVATPALQTLTDLQFRLRSVLSKPGLQRGQVGVKIVSLDAEKVIFEQNAEKYFMPASNMKSFTVAAALERLSPNYRFTTSVYAASQPDTEGVIKGDLTVYGRGDVSISTAFYEGDYYRGVDALAEKIAQAGIKRIEGNLIGDESYFSGNPIPPSWEWDDLQWYYGAEISALALNDNAVDLSVKPSAVNMPCSVQIQPVNTLYKIVNRCITVTGVTKRDIKVFKKIDQNILEVSGTIPVGDSGYNGSVTISKPAQLFIEMLRQRLLQKGITVTGRNLIKDLNEQSLLTPQTLSSPPVEVAKLESQPFSVIAAKTMKPSQNLYTETILWTLGEQVGRRGISTQVFGSGQTQEDLSKKTSAELGIRVVQDFLKQIGIAPDSVVQWDGSGLSRHNLITPSAAVQLYLYMAKRSPNALAWQNSLTIGGVDGTLRNRFKGTKAEANARGKTGTIDQVSALTGYVTTAAGEKLVFSVLVNGVPENRLRVATIDEIVVALANFDGKTQ